MPAPWSFLSVLRDRVLVNGQPYVPPSLAQTNTTRDATKVLVIVAMVVFLVFFTMCTVASLLSPGR